MHTCHWKKGRVIEHWLSGAQRPRSVESQQTDMLELPVCLLNQPCLVHQALPSACQKVAQGPLDDECGVDLQCTRPPKRVSPWPADGRMVRRTMR